MSLGFVTKAVFFVKETSSTNTIALSVTTSMEMESSKAFKASPERAVLFILHGLGEHSGRYLPFISTLNANGITAHTMDWHGHGQASGNRGDIGDWEGISKDVDAFLARGEGNTPRFLFGHSMGALIALQYCLKRESGAPLNLQGIILSAPPISVPNRPSRVPLFFYYQVGRIVPRLCVDSGTRIEQLSRDKDYIKERNGDPACHQKISLRTARMAFEVADEIRGASKLVLSCPLLGILAGRDSVVDVEAARGVCEAIQAPSKKIKEWPDAYHDLLGDLEREQVKEEIVTWINNQALGDKK